MLGLKKGCVELVPHTEQWHQSFAEESVKILNAAGTSVIAVEHIGSTSICGISAKPILDIGAAIGEIADGEKCIKPLEDMGYEYRGEYGIPGRFYFVKGEPRTHHLHMLKLSSDAWKNHLLFRNYLRDNPAAAQKYDELKKELAQKHSANRNDYLDGKSAFVENILKTARAFYG